MSHSFILAAPIRPSMELLVSRQITRSMGRSTGSGRRMPLQCPLAIEPRKIAAIVNKTVIRVFIVLLLAFLMVWRFCKRSLLPANNRSHRNAAAASFAYLINDVPNHDLQVCAQRKVRERL